MKAENAIEKMLAASMVHIKPETCTWLRDEMENDESDLFILAKGGEGFIIYLSLDDDRDMIGDGAPDDLKTVMQAAYDADCWWLCLDGEGFEIDGLPEYRKEWDKVL